ncbi:hypothetical protein A0J61_10400 [Choanephora cucurbitarum]|uniref:Uncharacterized protein n=1 Tax=Choanephora cucurbitarum TaxID=101091 RepID=A0A1C7MXQ9_9FUNG|nr:hypothetical protein A0J61_10400 [Choanephora cucurbitarum]
MALPLSKALYDNSSKESTNKIILDYLLYLSIQSRLKQARVELLELSLPLPQSKKEEDAIQKRKQRWEDTASKAEKDKNAVESIVAGILSNHCNKTIASSNSTLEQRLHLCQLTNLVFGRFDALSTGQHVIAHSTARRRRHEFHIVNIDDDHDDDDQDCIKQRQRFFSVPITPPFCRRHRIQSCYGCRSPYLKDKPEHAMSMNQLHELEEDKPTDTNQESFKTLDLARISPPVPPAGLIEAIPTFLRTSADMLRRALESPHDMDIIFAGQKVMGGGMPPRWYDLFLELLTQAAIESYLCDTQAGLEPIFEIFSYGDVEDEEDEEDSEHEDEEDSEQALDEWGIRAADHHLLFPKTRTMHLFKTQVREREKDFLFVEEGVSLQAHFERLALRYPLETFEKNISEFIQMVLGTMDIPTLDKYEQHTEEEKTLSGPSVYKFPDDGSLLMPEIPDDDTVYSKKRSASESMDHEHEKKHAKR